MDEMVTAVHRAGGQIARHPADVTITSEVDGFVQPALDQFRQIDVFFNNAGIDGWAGPLQEYPEDEFDRVFVVNVKGVVLGLQVVAQVMRKRIGSSPLTVALVPAVWRRGPVVLGQGTNTGPVEKPGVGRQRVAVRRCQD